MAVQDEYQDLRVLMVIPSLRKGGAERMVIETCRALEKQGIQTLIYCLEEKNEYEHLTTGLQIVYGQSWVQLSVWKKNKADLRHFEEVVAAFRPHVIHSHLFAAEIFTRYDLIPGIRYVSHAHDNMHQLRNFSWRTLSDKQALTNMWEKQWILRRYRHCRNRFIAISQDNAAYLRDVLPGSMQRDIHLLPNAIDVERFYHPLRQPSPSMLRIINVGSMIPLKNQQLLLEVVRELCRRGIDTHLTLLGDGPERARLEAQATTIGPGSRIDFRGNNRQVEEHLGTADIYVHTSRSEAFGLVMIEAMAAGLPVIALDGGGNRDLILQGENGYLLTREDPAFFADHILAVWQDKARYLQMAGAAQAFARRFDIHDYAKQLIQLYSA